MVNNKLAGCFFFVFCLISLKGLTADSELAVNQIPHLKQVINLDGSLDDKVWESALVISLDYEIDPGENIAASVETQAFIFEDGENLYIGFNANEPNPEKIRAYLSDRDDLWRSDYVGITLDTFNDSRRGYQFFTNAIGVQADAILDEVADNTDVGWDAIWHSAGALNSQGYQVEMAIPLKSLRFTENKGLKEWKIKFSRTWIRDVEHQFSSVRHDRNRDCQICQYDTFVGFESIKPAQNLTLIPAVTFLNNQTRGEAFGAPWVGNGVVDRESLDLRWGINQNVFLNATINPDFSQVEADAIQLEVNKRSAVRTKEKRAFFLDGADYFSNWSRLVYTKLFGEPKYGLKLTGKTGGHSYGVIALSDKDTSFLLPDSQSSKIITLNGLVSHNNILRYRYDLGNKGNAGFTYTQREGDDYSNRMLSFDTKYWFGDSDYLKVQLIDTDTQNPLSVQQDYNQPAYQSGQAYSLNYTHVTRDWGVYLTHHNFDKGFRADSGFVGRSNWQLSSLQLDRNWYPSNQNTWWKSLTASYTFTQVFDADGKQLNDIRLYGAEGSGIYQSEFALVYTSDVQNYVAQSIPSDSHPSLLLQPYDIGKKEFYGQFTPVAGFNIGVAIEWGDDIDFTTGRQGTVLTIVPNAEYQVNDHWRLTLDYTNQKLKVDNQEVYNVHLGNFRAAYQISVNSFLRLTLQSFRQGVDRSLASQLLYSYQLDPFTLFYFGYSDNGYHTDTLQRFKRLERSLFVKFSYAWQL